MPLRISITALLEDSTLIAASSKSLEHILIDSTFRWKQRAACEVKLRVQHGHDICYSSTPFVESSADTIRPWAAAWRLRRRCCRALDSLAVPTAAPSRCLKDCALYHFFELPLLAPEACTCKNQPHGFALSQSFVGTHQAVPMSRYQIRQAPLPQCWRWVAEVCCEAVLHALAVAAHQ